jgi:hypothetical protein
MRMIWVSLLNYGKRIILKMDVKIKSMGLCALDSCHEGYGPTDGSCEYANVLLSSTACNKFF